MIWQGLNPFGIRARVRPAEFTKAADLPRSQSLWYQGKGTTKVATIKAAYASESQSLWYQGKGTTQRAGQAQEQRCVSIPLVSGQGYDIGVARSSPFFGSLNPFGIRARVRLIWAYKTGRISLSQSLWYQGKGTTSTSARRCSTAVSIPLVSGQGYDSRPPCRQTEQRRLNPFGIRARVRLHTWRVACRSSGVSIPLVSGQGYDNPADEYVTRDEDVSIPLVSGQGYDPWKSPRLTSPCVSIPLVSGQGYDQQIHGYGSHEAVSIPLVSGQGYDRIISHEHAHFAERDR